LLPLLALGLFLAGCASVGSTLNALTSAPASVVGVYDLISLGGQAVPYEMASAVGQLCPEGGTVQRAIITGGTLELHSDLRALLRGQVELQCAQGGQTRTTTMPQDADVSFTAVGSAVRIRMPGEPRPLPFAFNAETGELASLSGAFVYQKQGEYAKGSAPAGAKVALTSGSQNPADIEAAAARAAGGTRSGAAATATRPAAARSSGPAGGNAALTASLRAMVSQPSTFAKPLAECDCPVMPRFGPTGVPYGYATNSWTEGLRGGPFTWIHQVAWKEVAPGNDYEGGISGGGWAYRITPEREEMYGALVIPGTADFRPVEHAPESMLPAIKRMARAERERALPHVYKSHESKERSSGGKRWTRTELRAAVAKNNGEEIRLENFFRLRGPGGKTLYLGSVHVFDDMQSAEDLYPIDVTVLIDEQGNVVHRTDYIAGAYWPAARGDLNGDGVDEIFVSGGVVVWDGTTWRFPEPPHYALT
jgi:hypothetical protein